MRNPSRTSATAAALMIGVSLVTFVAVFGAGIKSAAKGEMGDKIQAHYVVAPDGWTNVSAGSLEAAAKVPGVTVASGVRQSVAEVGNETDRRQRIAAGQHFQAPLQGRLDGLCRRRHDALQPQALLEKGARFVEVADLVNIHCSAGLRRRRPLLTVPGFRREDNVHR